ncbi:CHAD domain-containing protein [Pseudomonas mangrovi]|uniref:Metal-chelation protein CHAD n=1 Tax=Pseudomonas mangrovi TaxID=2161748 RepID=A0A2T5P793_9PSED|nr:CHAD domain-containing protein [Pseudomonas mangrovi]PTU73628.1 metal-chelation protein CHAD [Pseudomonas mangrovi]
MSSRVDSLVASGLGLEVRLQACLARLRADTDSEALHDLRIALRRLRSLLRPLRKLESVAELDRAAQAVGRLSSPMRDAEVLHAELSKRGQAQLLAVHDLHLREKYAQLLVAPELARLQQLLGQWPDNLREQQRAGELARLDRRIRRYLRKQQRKLCDALADPAHDRHRLRLLIKRLRYADEAYPDLSRMHADLRGKLKAAQSALGDWHDRWQWLLRLAADPQLAPMQAAWEVELVKAERQADQALEALRRALSA